MKRIAGVVVLAALAGCASWWGRTPQHIVDVAVLLECVVAHDRESPAQIVVECAAENEQQVIDLLTAYRRAAARQRATLCKPSSE